MKIKASALKRLIHLLIAIFSLLLIWQIDDASQPWLKAGLLMAWLTFFLIDLSRVFFLGTNISITGAYLLFYVGALLGCLFLVWTGNMVLKSANFIFIFLDWEFRIGNLFNGLWHYLFSWPGLIAGIILVVSALLWENDLQYRAWHMAFTRSLRMAND